MKLAVTQIILGILATVSAVFEFFYGLPTAFSSGNMILEVMWSPQVVLLHYLYVSLFLVVGLFMLGLGIAKSRLLRGKSPRLESYGQ